MAAALQLPALQSPFLQEMGNPVDLCHQITPSHKLDCDNSNSNAGHCQTLPGLTASEAKSLHKCDHHVEATPSSPSQRCLGGDPGSHTQACVYPTHTHTGTPTQWNHSPFCACGQPGGLSWPLTTTHEGTNTEGGRVRTLCLGGTHEEARGVHLGEEAPQMAGEHTLQLVRDLSCGR